jgi:hypothetical protein
LAQAVISHGKIPSQWSDRDNAAAAVREIRLEIYGEAADKVRISLPT